MCIRDRPSRWTFWKADTLPEFQTIFLLPSIPQTIKCSPHIKKVKRLPVLVTKRWARSWSRYAGSQPAGDYKSSTRRLAAITSRQACGYLSSCKGSPPVGRYQVILLGDRGTYTCEQLAQGSYAVFAPSRIWTHANPTLHPLRHRATYTVQ